MRELASIRASDLSLKSAPDWIEVDYGCGLGTNFRTFFLEMASHSRRAFAATCVPAIGLSDRRFLPLRRLAIQAGTSADADGHLTKPITPNSLLSSIEVALAERVSLGVERRPPH